MNRLSLILLLATLCSAFFVVHTKYRSRLLVTTIEKAQSDLRKLETENDSLTSQLRTQATSLRVEQLAISKLNMRTPTPATTQYITLNAKDDVVSTHIAIPQIIAAPDSNFTKLPSGVNASRTSNTDSLHKKIILPSNTRSKKVYP